MYALMSKNCIFQKFMILYINFHFYKSHKPTQLRYIAVIFGGYNIPLLRSSKEGLRGGSHAHSNSEELILFCEHRLATHMSSCAVADGWLRRISYNKEDMFILKNRIFKKNSY